MLHIRVVAPPALAASVLEQLGALESVINVVHLPGAARKPDGDLVTCDVAREDGSVVLATLRELGCEARGTVAVEAIEVSISRAADAAEARAAGSPADAVVWEEVTAQTSESAELSFGYLLFMALAALIAAVGILTDSVVLLIGAMVVGPEFGPLAGLCVALVQRRFALAGRSALALAIGFAVGIVAATAFTGLLVATGLAPPAPAARPHMLFISRPDAYAAIIALLAGVAGMFSLTTSKPGALIGVFISVTTLPAAVNVGIAAAYRNAAEARGAAVQLGLNLATMVVAGVATLLAQRLAFRRRREALRRRSPGRPGG
ncbi:MAG TPA: DUF389 domain-containing protein [Polyangiaceae bacterium]|nr:DUF389 domain-containing protein [Polyangiaceae bacterium]